jgi:hypothetical protein
MKDRIDNAGRAYTYDDIPYQRRKQYLQKFNQELKYPGLSLVPTPDVWDEE